MGLHPDNVWFVKPMLYLHTSPKNPNRNHTLTLQILQCVTMNLTLLYALLAYSSIKQRDFSGVYVSPNVLSDLLGVHVHFNQKHFQFGTCIT